MMKKIAKTLAVVVDLAFMPIRIIVVAEMALTAALIHDDMNEIKEYINDGIYGAKVAFRNAKPVLNDIWND